MLTEAAKGTRTRIRLLDLQGGVQSDSHRLGPPEGPEQPPPSFFARVRRNPPGGGMCRNPRIFPGAGRFARRWEGGMGLRRAYGRTAIGCFYSPPCLSCRPGRCRGWCTSRAPPIRFGPRSIDSGPRSCACLLASMAATAVLSLFLAGTISRPLTKLSRVAERIAAGREESVRGAGSPRRNWAVVPGLRQDGAQPRCAGPGMSGSWQRISATNSSRRLRAFAEARNLLLEGAAEDPAARDRFLRNMLSDAMRLDRLVTRLLELSRVEAEASAPEVFDYEALVRETAARCSGACEVVVEYAAASPLLRGRPAQLASALGNLLDNAQQHAAPGSEVRIRVSDGPGGRVRTAVHNQGEPIREPNLARIWERFYTTRAGQGGTGLGLPIVASVAAAHGGAVDVTSSESDGTWFLLDPTQVLNSAEAGEAELAVRCQGLYAADWSDEISEGRQETAQVPRTQAGCLAPAGRILP